LDRFLFPLIIK